MRILLDENLPHDLRHFLAGHDVFTVAFMGWRGLENGDLLAMAAQSGFDALVTMDVGLGREFDSDAPPLAVILLRAPSNALDDLRSLVPAILNAFAALTPRAIVRIGS